MKINFWRYDELKGAEKARVMARAESDIQSVTESVLPIIEDVRLRGDDALRDYAKKFDKADIKGGIAATDEDFALAYKELDPLVTEAIKTCANNVMIHHKQQMARVEKQWMEEVQSGVWAGEKITPIPSAGLYVPRGKGAFPSSMYMLCAAAKCAGVPVIAVCTPPTEDGGLDAASLVAADICGVRTVYKAGGAQAIAALAYGTQSIPKVVKVSGPGSPYVAAAKRLLSHIMDPGMAAGPSESIVLADESADPWNCALDIMNEAEHGPDSACIFVTSSKELAEKVRDDLIKVINSLPEPRKQYCETVFSDYGGIMLCPSMEDCIDFCNDYAPEHLILKVLDVDSVLNKLQNAGEILIGETTPSTLGNFGIGINHVLPTGGNAKSQSCTSVWDFLKRTSLSYVSPKGYQSLKDPVVKVADYEGFPGHAKVLTERNEAVFRDLEFKKQG